MDALLGSSDSQGRADRSSSSTTFVELPVAALVQGKFQPRQTIDDEGLGELVQSIQQQGVLAPILVRAFTGPKADTGMVTHEIVAGERRWRAARLAGLGTVPVVIRELDDKAAIAVALIENLQREDLNPVEIAESLLRLTQEFGLTHQQAADSVGRSRSSVTNLLRLLDLEASARGLLAAGHLDMGHARALLSLHAHQQEIIAKKITAEGLSVRQVEQLVANLQESPSGSKRRTKTAIDVQTRWLQKQFANEAGLKVGIRPRKDGGSTLAIDFDDLEQLQNALLKIEELVGQVRETAGPRVRDAKN